MKKETLLDTLQSQKHAEENQNKDNYSDKLPPIIGNYDTQLAEYENSKQLRIYHNVENTPFIIVEENNLFTMIMGDYKLHTEPYNSFEECKEDMLINKIWHTIGAYLFALHDFTKKLEKEQNKPLS